MTKEEIIDLVCKKHIKIYKLNQLGFTNKEIAKLLSTNYGYVYNVIKKYSLNASLIENAAKL